MIEGELMHASKHNLVRLVAGSLTAASSLFGLSGMAAAADDPGLPPVPAPTPPNIPENPIEEGLPVPLPGGGA